MAFAGAQVFFLDPSLVKQSSTMALTCINVYFKQKPQATGNKSGINNPGATMYLTGTANGIPVLPVDLSQCRSSRINYSDAQVSSDASAPTSFRFDPPVPFPTNQNVAYIIQYDGDEDFDLWQDISGQYLVGTTTVSNGPSGAGIGGYFSYISGVPTVVSNTTSNSNIIQAANASSTSNLANNVYAAASWTPSTGTALKFSAFCARYSVAGDPNLANYAGNSIANNTIYNSVTTVTTANGESQYVMPQDRYEYIAYDRINSSTYNINAGERVFPILPEYPPGFAAKVTLNAQQGQTSITATGNVNFNNIVFMSANQPQYIVIRSGNALGANADTVNVRMITSITSNTGITVDQPLSFTNSVATFWLAPVATVDQFKTAKFFGNTVDVVMCKASSATPASFFAGHCANSITIVSGGTGYSNTDWIRVTGHNFVAGKILHAYNANANIVTNGSGVITNIYLANVGSGFTNTANVTYTIFTVSNTASAGSGANLTISTGTNIKGEFLGFSGKGGNFANIHPIDIAIGEVMPAVLVSTPTGSYYNASLRFPYYQVADPAAVNGFQTYCDVDGAWDVLDIETFTTHEPYEFTKRRALPSWSRELYTPYANGTSSGGLGGTSNGFVGSLSSNASVITMTTVSNNDFAVTTLVPQGTSVTYSRYIINNDYTAENTNYGNSWAKGVEVKFNLAANTLAEDLLVYATCYQPANTTVLAFAKIYNTQDNDAFDTKDWTMLQLKSGNAVVSSPTNLSDTYELTWGFQQYPNVAYQVAGSINTTNGSKVLTGVGTNFTANVTSGDMLLIQNNLFPNLYMIAIANSITNTTSMTINKPIANLNLVGSGFTLSKIAYKYQAFNNGLNDNVSRYYSSTLTENDGFNACALKLVLLSANGLSVPLVADLRAVAVSA